jgi:hypothetical protein
MVLRDGWRGIHQKVEQGVEILVARTSVFCARTWSFEMACRWRRNY